MADDVPPVPGAATTPSEPRFAWFDGIVEGRLGDAAAVRAAAARANGTGYGRMDVGVDAGRFSVLMDDETVPSSRMSDENRRLFAGALAEIASAAEGPVESTLRCTEVFRDEVRETLFLAEGGTIRALSRTRPVTPADLGRSPDQPAAAAPMGRARFLLVGLLVVVALGLTAWQGGWIDRLLSAGAETIRVDTGPFRDLVGVEVAKSWGDYEVTLRRGAGYPVESARVEELRAAAATPADRAALEAVATGGTLWIRVENGQGRGLAVERAELGPLAAGADRSVVKRLPGRIGADRVVLSVEAGPEFK